jgi:hypothetical protein
MLNLAEPPRIAPLTFASFAEAREPTVTLSQPARDLISERHIRRYLATFSHGKITIKLERRTEGDCGRLPSIDSRGWPRPIGLK